MVVERDRKKHQSRIESDVSHFNLTHKQKQAITELTNNSFIMIKMSDRGA